jgi:hypothetical protein
MIKQSAQKRCIWIVLALFSAIAVVGDGLHFLPGLGHDCRGMHPPLVAQADCHGGGCAEEATNRVEEGLHKYLAATSTAPNDDDCPICQYCSQAQSVSLTVDFDINFCVVERRITTIRSLFVDHVAGAYSSRAPPSCL